MLQFPVKLFGQLHGKCLRHLSELSKLSILCRLIFLRRLDHLDCCALRLAKSLASSK